MKNKKLQRPVGELSNNFEEFCDPQTLNKDKILKNLNEVPLNSMHPTEISTNERIFPKKLSNKELKNAQVDKSTSLVAQNLSETTFEFQFYRE